MENNYIATVLKVSKFNIKIVVLHSIVNSMFYYGIKTNILDKSWALFICEHKSIWKNK